MDLAFTGDETGYVKLCQEFAWLVFFMSLYAVWFTFVYKICFPRLVCLQWRFSAQANVHGITVLYRNVVTSAVFNELHKIHPSTLISSCFFPKNIPWFKLFSQSEYLCCGLKKNQNDISRALGQKSSVIALLMCRINTNLSYTSVTADYQSWSVGVEPVRISSYSIFV